MRFLLICGTLITAMVIPFSSLTPTWVKDFDLRPANASTFRSAQPAVKLLPALGIVPMEDSEFYEEVARCGQIIHDTALIVLNQETSSKPEALQPAAFAHGAEETFSVPSLELSDPQARPLGAYQENSGQNSKVVCKDGVCELVPAGQLTPTPMGENMF